jgi:hypothetical protein
MVCRIQAGENNGVAMSFYKPHHDGATEHARPVLKVVAKDEEPLAEPAKEEWLGWANFFARKFGISVKDKSDETFFRRKRGY